MSLRRSPQPVEEFGAVRGAEAVTAWTGPAVGEWAGHHFPVVVVHDRAWVGPG